MRILKQVDPVYLEPTEIIDSTHPKIRDYAREVIGASGDPVERAVKLYLAVRDGIRYDPYTPFHLPEHYRASAATPVSRLDINGM